MNDRPATQDGGLAEERTSLAWERSAFSMVVVGTLLARISLDRGLPIAAGAAVTQAVLGLGVLVWSSSGSFDRAPPRSEIDPFEGPALLHPVAAWLLGASTTVFSVVALLAMVRILIGR